MIDRRRCLTVVLVCLGLMVLVLALGCSSGLGTGARVAALDEPLTVGGLGSVGRAEGPEINPCDPRCSHRGVSTTIPDGAAVACWQRAALAYVRSIVLDGSLQTALPPLLAAQYLNLPAVLWHSCPVWLDSANAAGEIVFGCMAGVAWGPRISISLGEPARVLPLVSWETSNSLVTYQLARYDLADGAEVAAATNYASSVCQ